MPDTFSSLQSAAHSGAFGAGSKDNPTAEQIRAGNYAKGATRLHGLKVTVETPMYQSRRGKQDAQPWSVLCMAHYGYINGTKGADGDAVDVFIGPIPESLAVFVVNQQNKAGGFDEHKVLLGFTDEDQARNAYLNSYEKGWTGLASLTPCSIKQFKYWLKHGDLSQPLQPGDLISDGTVSMTDVLVSWDGKQAPVGPTTMADVLCELRRNDREGLLFDSATLGDINEMFDGGEMLDAMVIELKQFDRKAGQLLKVMQNAAEGVRPSGVEVSKPFKNRGTTQVAMLFSMDDGQSVSVFFHNPDSTPNKLLPSDEMVSWKWVLNKKDITITVAPERGQDLNPREVARRIMKLVQKNSAKFIQANASKADLKAKREELKTSVETKTAELESLDQQIEALSAQLTQKKAEPLAQLPNPVENAPGATVEPQKNPDDGLFGNEPPPPDTRDNLAKFKDGLKAGDVDSALKVVEAIEGADELRELLLKAGFSLGASVTKADIMAGVSSDLVRAAKAGVDGFGLRDLDKVPAASGVEPGADRLAWDTAFIGKLAELLESPESDAQGVAMAQQALVTQLFTEGMPPDDAAKSVHTLATGGSEDEEDAGTIEAEGRENTVKTAKGTKVVTGFKVIEARKLVISHETDGTPNPDYPAEIQPRDRARTTSQAWVQKTARSLDPDSLGRTQRADSGAPIVGSDRVVESGNGRAMAIREAYRLGMADDYREWLVENAEYFGVDVAKIQRMKAPVLVRVRKTDVDRVEFAVESNQDDKLAMTATEKARSDAKRLDSAMLAKLADGDLNSAANRDFVAAFLQSLGDAEAAQYLTTDGKPTSGLISRLQAALFAGAYSDDRLLEMTADVAKPEIANIVSALNSAAPDFMRAKEQDRVGAEDAGGLVTDSVELSLNQEAVNAIIGATNVLQRAKEAGMGLDEFIRQGDMFGDTDPAIAAMAMFISQNNRSAKRMGTAFKAMAQFVESENMRKQTAGLFGDAPASFADIVGAANRKLEQEYGEGLFAIDQGDMFASQAPSPVVPQDPVPDEDEKLKQAKAYLDSLIAGTIDLGSPAEVLAELERIYSGWGEGELQGLFVEASDAYRDYALKATAGAF